MSVENQANFTVDFLSHVELKRGRSNLMFFWYFCFGLHWTKGAQPFSGHVPLQHFHR